MSEIDLQDAILRHALELQRLSDHEEAQALEIIQQLENELRQLLASYDLSEAGKRDINDLIRQAQDAIDGRYGAIATQVDTHGLMMLVADRTVEAMRQIMPEIAAPTAERLASLTKEVMIDGAPTKAWWDKQGEDLGFRFAGQVRQGIVNGETQERIVGRIVGRQGEPGIMDMARRAVRALVHSSIMTAANDARLATYRNNPKFIDGMRWLATLDSHTCLTCAALDGAQWSLDGEPMGKTKFDFETPPAHWSCRCVLSPVAPSLNDIFGTGGLDEMLAGLSQRASSQGPVAGTTTFSDFLKRQPDSFVEDVLGKRRATLFQAGKLTLTDLITKAGRPKTLDELRTR